MKIDETLYNVNHRVMCIDHVQRKYESCIGFCNNSIHKGFVTKKLLTEHRCIEKKCSFLDIIEDHSYWIEIANKKKRKAEIKKKNKMIKDTEKAILEEANIYLEVLKQEKKLLSKKAEAVFCKHLTGSTYLLLLINSSFVEGLNQKIQSSLGVNIYIKIISKKQQKNIEYTYVSLLDDETRTKIKYKK